MRHIVTILAVALVAAAGRADDGPVTVKVKQAGPGDRVKETKTENATNKVSFSVMGMDQAKEDKVTTKFVYTDEVIEKPAGAKRATKLKRVYETAEMTKDGEKVDLGLAGKTVVIEKKGSGYDIMIDGKEVSGPGGDLLKKEFRKEKQVEDEDLLPKEPVKVGGTWKIDLTKLAEEASDELDVDVPKSTGTGKLIKVYDKDGHKFGVVEITLDLALNKIGPSGQAVELKPGSKLQITATLDTCIDGSRNETTGKMAVKGAFSGTAMGIELKFDLQSQRDGASVEVGKK
jgi:hypothetical protein